MINTRILPSEGMVVGAKRFSEGALGSLSHVNPATGTEQGRIPIADEVQVDAAVKAAWAAFPAWRDLPASHRRDLLNRLADLLRSEGETMASIGVLDNGTPISVTRNGCSVLPSDWFRYYAGWIDKIEGRTIPIYPGNLFDYTKLIPFGVVGLLTAFNGPMAFIGFKVAPALAAGNTVVLKPSELAPWTSIRFAELCLEAGIPPGVVNVITGDGRTGQALASHRGIRKISFTGSGATASRVMAAASANLIPFTAELGGKSAVILFADGNPSQTVPLVTRMVLSLLSGQVCLAGTRLFVERSVYAKSVEQAIHVAQTIKIGDPRDDATQMGPVISAFHADRILKFVAAARDRGDGKLVLAGERIGGSLAGGSFVSPSIFSDVDPTSPLGQEEIFGPVLSILPFDTEEEAVRLANATRFGLGGYVFTADVRRAHRVADALEAGFISVNTYGMCPPGAPFGGVKGSGFGREGGWDGLREMLTTKNVQMSLN